MSTKDWADQVTTNLYSHFILRDFAFLSGGSAFLLLVVIMLEKSQVVFSSPLNIVFFFGAAYFVGILMMEACIYGKVFRMTPGKGPEGSASAESDEDNWPLLLYKLHRINIHPAVLVALERTAYLKQVAACIGGAALFSALFALIHGVWLWHLCKPPSALHYWTFFVGVGILLLCRKENQQKADLQYKSVHLLLSENKQKPGDSQSSHRPTN